MYRQKRQMRGRESKAENEKISLKCKQASAFDRSLQSQHLHWSSSFLLLLSLHVSSFSSLSLNSQTDYMTASSSHITQNQQRYSFSTTIFQTSLCLNTISQPKSVPFCSVFVRSFFTNAAVLTSVNSSSFSSSYYYCSIVVKVHES